MSLKSQIDYYASRAYKIGLQDKKAYRFIQRKIQKYIKKHKITNEQVQKELYG